MLKKAVEMMFVRVSKVHFQQLAFLYSWLKSSLFNIQALFQQSFQQSAESVLMYEPDFLSSLHIKLLAFFIPIC